MPRQKLKQRSDGRYRCMYGSVAFYGWTIGEALAARDEYKRELAVHSHAPVETTVQEYIESWLPTHKASVSTKCYNDYRKQLDRLIAVCGQKRMADVVPSDIKAVYNHYIGYSESTIKRSRMLLIALFDSAVDDDICRKNPARSESAKPHHGTAGTHRPLTPEEDRLILETPADLRLAVLVMRYAGLRRGEALSINIDRDIDFKAKVIHVRQAVRYESNQPILSDPKTAAGVRDVPLFKILAAELRGHHGLLAPSATGEVMTSSAFRSAWAKYVNTMETAMNGCPRRWYGKTKEHKALAAKKRLPAWKDFTVRPHDLRHSFATSARDAGVDMKVLISWMGHSDEKMILRIYDHITDTREQAAVRAMDRAYL